MTDCVHQTLARIARWARTLTSAGSARRRPPLPPVLLAVPVPVRRRHARRRRGFTLIELLVVLAVIGVLAGIGIPYTIETLHRRGFVSAVDCAANLMRIARLQAIRQNANVSVSLDGRVLTVENGQTHPPSCQLPSVVDTVAVDGWPINGGKPVFLANGSAVEDGAFRFGDRRGNVLEVRLAPAAIGRIEVRKFDGSNWVGRDQGGWKWS